MRGRVERIEPEAAVAAYDMATRLKDLDADAIAQRVSWQVLKGFGEALDAVAE